MKAVDPAGQSDSDTDTVHVRVLGRRDADRGCPPPRARSRPAGWSRCSTTATGPSCATFVAESFPPAVLGHADGRLGLGGPPRARGPVGREVGDLRPHRHLRRHDVRGHRGDPGRVVRRRSARSPSRCRARRASRRPVGGASWTRPRPPRRRWTRPSRGRPRCPASPGRGWTSSRTPVAGTNDPTKVIINVAVTEDVEGAEADAARDLGRSPVRQPGHATPRPSSTRSGDGAAEAARRPHVLGAPPTWCRPSVLFDDGSLQAWADEDVRRGPGRDHLRAPAGRGLSLTSAVRSPPGPGPGRCRRSGVGGRPGRRPGCPRSRSTSSVPAGPAWPVTPGCRPPPS